MLDPRENPYTPNAGARPFVLAGRASEEEAFEHLLARVARGESAQSLLVTGLRGVGKTVLLNRFDTLAEAQGWIVVAGEVTKTADLSASVVRLARRALLDLDPPKRWSRAAERCAAALRALSLNIATDGTFALSWSGFPEVEPGLADSGDLAMDMTDLLVSLGEAAAERGRGVLFLFDELQFAAAEPLSSFITALHKVVQRSLPVTVVGAGLPMLPEVVGQAKSYAERLFTNTQIGALHGDAVRIALEEPAKSRGVHYQRAAIDHIVRFTEGYPFFLQVYGSLVWRAARGDAIITADDARDAQTAVRDELDGSFFKARVGGLTDAQRRYLRALAEADEAEVPTGDVAATLGLDTSAKAGNIRDALIRRGLVYAPRLGHTSFTVPQFGDYMRRHYELEHHTPTRRAPRDRSVQP